MKETKVQFSTSEMELMCNSEIILTKNKVIEKVKLLLEELQNEMTEKSEADPHLFANPVFSVHPKISKGENYLGLPYLILDYPRIFRPNESFAIRTMFWWGNFFSTTLHLSGFHKVRLAPKLEAKLNLLSGNGWSLGVNQDPWIHHFEDDNYKPIALIQENNLQEVWNNSHLKLAKQISLNEPRWPNKLLENWELLVKICFH